MSRIPECTTQIIITSAGVEFVNHNWRILVRRDPYNNAHGLTWYTVETFEKAGLVSWTQASRMIMSAEAYDYEYKRLTEQVMGMEQQLDPKHVSFEVFAALCKGLT